MSGLNTLFCPQCNKQFKSIRGQKEHISNNICYDKIKKLTCSKCFVVFASTQSLQYHNNNVTCVKKIKIKPKTKENSITDTKQNLIKEFNDLLSHNKTLMDNFYEKYHKLLNSEQEPQ